MTKKKIFRAVCLIFGVLAITVTTMSMTVPLEELDGKTFQGKLIESSEQEKSKTAIFFAKGLCPLMLSAGLLVIYLAGTKHPPFG